VFFILHVRRRTDLISLAGQHKEALTVSLFQTRSL